MSTPTTFKGWEALGPDAIEAGLVWRDMRIRPWTEDMVDIAVTHCGVCGTDCHMIKNIWGFVQYPLTPGHEIVGNVVRVGTNVKRHKVGDRVGVGAQSNSCMLDSCEACSIGEESYCPKIEVTYGAPVDDGITTKGGYAEFARVPAHFAIHIPENLPSPTAATLLCAGITMFAPLKRYECKGKRVGIVGFGGLGYYGTKLAKMMGASKVVVFTRTTSKKEDALAAGADEFVATGASAEWHKPLTNGLDIILCTADSPDVPLSKYLRTLRFKGTFVQIGSGPGHYNEGFNYVQSLQPKGLSYSTSLIGSVAEIKELMQMAADSKLEVMIEVRKMEDVNQVLKDMEAGKPRYRYVLERSGAAGSKL